MFGPSCAPGCDSMADQQGAGVSRNNQVIRQWYLLRQLESTSGVTLEQLVDRLPDDYPKHPRTVRRDLAALEGVGFPLITEHANGRTLWKLLDGYRGIPALAWRSKPSRRAWRGPREAA